MRRIDHAITRLRDGLKDATMEHASFADLHFHPVTLTSRDQTDAYIKEHISLWLNSWVVGPMREACEILEQHRELVDASDALENALFGDSALGKAIKRLDSALETAKRYEG